jgi:xylan 1,4-beta-xylosidase
MKSTRKILVFILGIIPLFMYAETNPVKVSPVVNWNQVAGKLTADHWGLNNQNAQGFTAPNQELANYYSQVQPGVIRIMKNVTAGWVKDNSWDREKIRIELDNAQHNYVNHYAKRIMLCLYAPPPFINSGKLPLVNEAQEDSLAAFFAQLPLIIKSAGYHIGLYEFFNEKEPAYGALGGNSGKLEGTNANLPAYWRTLNKIAKAMKAADPTIKVGGPATAFPYENVYKGFIDNCADNMDFFSFHDYLTGNPGTTADKDLFNDFYAAHTLSIANVTAYARSKGKTHLEFYLDEWQVSYNWKKYEPLHDNHAGASWMACFIKYCALKGITGMNVWDYGFHPNAATFLLYSRFSPCLRGNIVQSSNTGDKIELIPVISESGEKSILLINKTEEKVRVANTGKLLDSKASTIKGFRLDESTLQNPDEANTSKAVYSIESITNVPEGIELNPYGMVLLTDISEDRTLRVNWNKVVGKITADHWGLNDFASKHGYN